MKLVKGRSFFLTLWIRLEASSVFTDEGEKSLSLRSFPLFNVNFHQSRDVVVLSLKHLYVVKLKSNTLNTKKSVFCLGP